MRAATGERVANRRADATTSLTGASARITSTFIGRTGPHFRPDNLNDERFVIHSDHNTKRGFGSAEDDSGAMCFLVIGKPDAEVAVEGDAIHLH